MFMPPPRLDRSTSTVDFFEFRPRIMEYVCMKYSKSSPCSFAKPASTSFPLIVPILERELGFSVGEREKL